MSEIKRLDLPPDGVQANINCAITQFLGNIQRILPCEIKCAMSLGTVDITVPELDLMINLRVDELIAIISEASKATLEFKEEIEGRTPNRAQRRQQKRQQRQKH